jgi:Zn-dependent peptidase ImmA (M78 family)
MGQVAIGRRVRRCMPPGMTQRSLAEQVEMPADALSRALNGERAFSSIELARIADLFDADLHWLITGEEDPRRLRVAARHHFDHETGERAVPGREQDEAVLSNVALAYRQAYPNAEHPSRPLPKTVKTVRKTLGDGFVREFADRVEAALDIDVVRVQNLTTDYSFTIGGRRVILLASHANWFRSNWSLAHELAHLVLGHHDVDVRQDTHEAAANAFAADVLLARSDLEGIDWRQIGPRDLAQFVWNAGVSNDALIRRLDSLGLPVAARVRGLLDGPTQRLLRRHLGEGPLQRGPFVVPVDPITERMNAASVRRFPLGLLDAHAERIAAGQIAPGTLAWMLDTSEADLVVDIPQVEHVSTDDLAAELGL